MSCQGSRRNSQVSIKNSFAQASASALATSASSAVLAASPRASAASSARASGLTHSASSAVLSASRASGRRSTSTRAPSTNNAETEFEQAIVNATAPIETTETEQITVGKFSGIFLNKSEVDAFRGPVPIAQYTINTECEPEVVKKKADKLKYTQEVSVKYLRPPQAPKPGDIIVREKQSTFPPAPPVIIRQLACQGQDPAPLVFRQKPPKKPACIPEQVVEIEGCPLPPPPRRVIIEKLSALPPKPQAIVVEKWLPYCAQKRRVVFQPSNAQAEYQCRNLLIEWEAPEVEVEKVCKNLGVEDADPEEYEKQYGADLKDESELPEVECGCAPQACPGGAAASEGVPELEGDLAALKRVDLEKYGLSAYKKFL